jgi:vancomycin resistance protein YoaR
MTDLSDSEAVWPGNDPAPDGEAPIRDPELAALVRRDAPPDAADAAEVSEAGADVVAVPVMSLAAAVADDEPVARPRRRHSLVLRFGVSFALGVLLAVGIGVGALYAWVQQYDGRVLPGVSVGGTDVGGLTRAEAEAAIADAYGWLGIGQIALTGPDGGITTIDYADLGRGPDTAALLDAALSAGRRGEPIADLVGAPQAALQGVMLGSAVVYDRSRLAAAIEALAASIDEAPVDAIVSAGADGTFSYTPAKDGRAVDTAALLQDLEPQLAVLEAPASISMPVPVVPLAPAIATATAEEATAAATRMAADVVLTHGEDGWTIPGSSLAPLISFATSAGGVITPVLDESGLDPILKALAPKVRQTVRDAGLKMVGGRVIATGESREGRALKVAETKAAIVGHVQARRAGGAPEAVEAVVKVTEPKLSSEDAEAFAPRMKVISKYSVFYWVIINNHWGGNIEAPATAIHGTVVPAGTKFDFWKTVGDVSRLPGVGPGNAIVNGKITVTGALGGGICTTSTTLFNAAFRAGMVPLAKKNHNEYITRYPAGLDATVWIVGKAKQTMSFKNDTEYPILITRTVTQDGSKRWLTFKIWSVPNGRTAKVSNTVIQHGPRANSVIVKDPTKPVGYRYLNNAPADGAKVWVTVSIYDHGKLHWRKRYFSNYPAVDGVTIVGTKGAS